MDGAVRSGERAPPRCWTRCDEAAARRRRSALAAPRPARARGPVRRLRRAREVDHRRSSRRCRRPAIPALRLRPPQRPASTPAATSTERQPPAARGVFEWSGSTARCSAPGRCPDRSSATTACRSANQTRDGQLLLLETSTSGGPDARPRAPAASARVARLPTGSVPNYAAWGPGPAPATSPTTPTARSGRCRRRPHGSVEWFSLRPRSRASSTSAPPASPTAPASGDLLITQQTAPGGLLADQRLPLPAAGPPQRASRVTLADAVDLPARRAARRLRHRPVRPHLRRAGRALRPARRALRRRGGAGPLPRHAAHRRQRLADPLRHPVQRHLPRHARCWSPTSRRSSARREPPGDPVGRGRRARPGAVPARRRRLPLTRRQVCDGSTRMGP